MTSLLLAGLFAGCSDYDLTPHNDGDTVATDTGVTRPGDSSQETLPPGETGGVSGNVCDPAGTGVVIGANVWAEVDMHGDGTNETRVETTTDQQGDFTLTGLPSGTWTVHVQKGSFSTSFEIAVTEGQVIEMAYAECLDGDSARVAVITGDYDHVQTILSDLGIEYDLFNGTGWSSEYLDFLKNSAQLESYDIVFFNCGFSNSWIIDQNTVTTNLKNFVEGGGSVYASDWAHYIVESSFPNAIDFMGDDSRQEQAQRGADGLVQADVIDPNMQALIGSDTASINYDLAAWVIIESAATQTEVLVKGTARSMMGGTQVTDSPLAVQFEVGAGQVIYTTFHNEQQTTFDMDKMLEEIVLSL